MVMMRLTTGKYKVIVKYQEVVTVIQTIDCRHQTLDSGEKSGKFEDTPKVDYLHRKSKVWSLMSGF